MKQVRSLCCSQHLHGILLHRLNSAHCVVSQEILDEVVRELHRVKDEIINGELESGSSFGTSQGRKAHCVTHIISLQPSDTKLAELAHPNPM